MVRQGAAQQWREALKDLARVHHHFLTPRPLRRPPDMKILGKLPQYMNVDRESLCRSTLYKVEASPSSEHPPPRSRCLEQCQPPLTLPPMSVSTLR